MTGSNRAQSDPAVRAWRAALAVLGALPLAAAAGPLAAAAQGDPEAEPAAIVEDIDAASVTDVGFMDFLYEGMEIALAEDETLTLSYLASCRIEEITGGLVKVGRRQSEVTSPQPIVVSAVDCDGGGIVPTERQGDVSAAVLFRQGPQDEPPPVRVNSTTPVFAFTEPVEVLTIERLDREMAPMTIEVAGPRLDFAERSLALKPGGLYRASAAGRAVLVRVPAGASRHSNSLVERLIAF